MLGSSRSGREREKNTESRAIRAEERGHPLTPHRLLRHIASARVSPELSIGQTHACNQPILMQTCVLSHSDLSGKVFDTSPYLWGPASGSAYQEA
jgi:hypothetical protein